MVSIGRTNKFYKVIKNMFIITLMVLTITLIVGCEWEVVESESEVVEDNSNVVEDDTTNSEYQETEKKLTGLTIYKYTSNQEHCPTWAYQTLFETEDYKYVYDNKCPTAYFILEGDEYIELIRYISLNSITNQEIEESGIGRKIVK